MSKAQGPSFSGSVDLIMSSRAVPSIPQSCAPPGHPATRPGTNAIVISDMGPSDNGGAVDSGGRQDRRGNRCGHRVGSCLTQPPTSQLIRALPHPSGDAACRLVQRAINRAAGNHYLITWLRPGLSPSLGRSTPPLPFCSSASAVSRHTSPLSGFGACERGQIAPGTVGKLDLAVANVPRFATPHNWCTLVWSRPFRILQSCRHILSRHHLTCRADHPGHILSSTWARWAQQGVRRHARPRITSGVCTRRGRRSNLPSTHPRTGTLTTSPPQLCHPATLASTMPPSSTLLIDLRPSPAQPPAAFRTASPSTAHPSCTGAPPGGRTAGTPTPSTLRCGASSSPSRRTRTALAHAHTTRRVGSLVAVRVHSRNPPPV